MIEEIEARKQNIMGGEGKDYNEQSKKAREEFAVKLRKDKMTVALNQKRLKQSK